LTFAARSKTSTKQAKMGAGKPAGIRSARKLRNTRRINRWADKKYKKMHFGNDRLARTSHSSTEREKEKILFFFFAFFFSLFFSLRHRCVLQVESAAGRVRRQGHCGREDGRRGASRPLLAARERKKKPFFFDDD
jgi:hypothetical protein